MITESSRDYGNRTVLILSEGETPSVRQVKQYVQEHYGTEPPECKIQGIEQSSEFFGMQNPGTITVKLLPAIEEMSGLIDFGGLVDYTRLGE